MASRLWVVEVCPEFPELELATAVVPEVVAVPELEFVAVVLVVAEVAVLVETVVEALVAVAEEFDDTVIGAAGASGASAPLPPPPF
jgi:hypothetical protein